jgi:hypothetical protein
MVKSPAPISRPALAAAFCALFFMAGLVSYTRTSAGSLISLQLGTRGGGKVDGFHSDASLDLTYGRAKHDTDSDDDGDQTLIVNEPRDITNDKSVLMKRPEPKASDQETPTDEATENDNQIGTPAEEESFGSEAGKNDEQKTKEVVKDTQSSVELNAEYVPTVEDCKTTKRQKQVGVFNKGPRFQYVHIPKTGGTSIQMEIAQWVFRTDVKIVLMKNDEPKIRGSSFACPPHVKEASYLIGHRGFGYCEAIEMAPKGLFTFATFRSSVSRIVSLFDYNMGREELRSVRVFGNTPLNTWVKRFNSTPELEEGERLLRFHGSQQVRFMCGYECIGPNAWHNHTISLPYMMKRAVENLKKLDVIGLTEHLNDVIPQLRFHIPYLPGGFKQWPVENHTTKNKRSVLDEQSLAILAEWGRPDAELYKIASELYKKKEAIARFCNRRNHY